VSEKRGAHFEGTAPEDAVQEATKQLEKRVALVIGNGAYEHASPLPNPINDARSMATKLTEVGFDVIEGVDLTYGAMAEQVRDFGRRAREAATTLLFYAGHGIQVDGRNFLVPIDAALEHESDVSLELIELQALLNQMAASDRTSLVFLDACRNNPLAKNLVRAMGMRSADVGSGLAATARTAGTFIAYATEPNHIAYDGDGAHGYFTEELLSRLATPGLEVTGLLRQVRVAVEERTQNKDRGTQIPWHQEALRGDFYFVPPSNAVDAPQPQSEKLSSSQDISFWKGEWEVQRDGQDLVALQAIADHAPPYFSSQARARIQQIEEEALKAPLDLKLAQNTKYWKTKDDGKDLYRIFVWLEGSEQDLSIIEKVVYTLHSSFKDPVREVIDRESCFELRTNGWGEFTMKAVVYFNNGRAPMPLSVDVKFKKKPKPSVEVDEPASSQARAYQISVGEGRNDRTVSLAISESIKDADYTPEMVLVPPGKFMMGAQHDEKFALEDEYPQHKVSIEYPLLVGKYAVTFDEWYHYVKETSSGGLMGFGNFGGPHKPRDQGWGRGKRPVINVSWEEATAYARWLSECTGKTYRLLSEAEWEYACRAGTTAPFSSGETISSDQANYNGNFSYGPGVKGEYRAQTVPVDRFAPNSFGLFQMHGNVWEWCADPWHKNYQGAPSDGSVWLDRSEERLRVLRGGSWGNGAQSLRSAMRVSYDKIIRNFGIGFRLSRTLTP